MLTSAIAVTAAVWTCDATLDEACQGALPNPVSLYCYRRRTSWRLVESDQAVGSTVRLGGGRDGVPGFLAALGSLAEQGVDRGADGEQPICELTTELYSYSIPKGSTSTSSNPAAANAASSTSPLLKL
jgi:hypothetical protein